MPQNTPSLRELEHASAFVDRQVEAGRRDREAVGAGNPAAALAGRSFA